MSNVPVSNYYLEHGTYHKVFVNLDLGFTLENDRPNPMFEEMHKTIYTLFNLLLGISIFVTILVNLAIEEDIIGITSVYYCVAYYCVQTKICQDLISIEEEKEISDHKEESESNRIYIVLSGCGSTFCMFVYMVSCQLDSLFFYHFAGVFLSIAALLTLFSYKKIKKRRNYLFLIIIGIIYILSFCLILK